MPVGLGGEKTWVCPTISGNVTAVDISGNSVALTQQSAVTVVSDTGSGGLYAFDMPGTASNQNMVLTNSAILGLVSSSFWFNPDNATAYGRMFSSSSNTFTVAQYLGALQINAAGGWEVALSGLSSATWYHVAIVADGTDIRCYVNGVLEFTSAKTNQFPSSAAYYGGKDNGNDRFNGQMDDMRTYDRVITQAEITHLATARGVLGGPGGSDGYNAFTSAIYNPRNYNNTRFG